MDKHLVNRQEVDGQPRFWLFETLCEFGLEQLSGSGEMLTLQHCHAAYYAQLSTETGQNYALWDLERPNLRMAFNWAITHQNGELALKLGDNFFAWERQVIEGGQLISKTLSLPGTQAKTSQRGWVLYSASALTLFSRDFPAAKQWLDELEALNQELNNQELTWWAKQLYLFYLAGCGDFEACLRLGLESRAQAGHFAYAQASLHIACSALQIQNEILAKELIQDAKDHYQKVDNPTQTMPYLVDCDTVLGYTALEEHQPGQALEYFRQAFRLALQLSVLPRVGAIYQGLGEVARQSGNFEEGVQWMSLAVTIAKTTGFSSRVVLDKLQKRYLEELKNWVNPSLFKDYWEAGQRLSMGQAITYGEERLLDK